MELIFGLFSHKPWTKSVFILTNKFIVGHKLQKTGVFAACSLVVFQHVMASSAKGCSVDC